MSDENVPTPTPETPAPAESAEAPEAAPKPKKAGIIRWWGLILVVLLVGGGYAAVQFVLPGIVRDKIKGLLAGQCMYFDPTTTIDVSVWDGAVSLKQAKLDEVRATAGKPEERHTVFNSPETIVDLGLIETITKRDVVIDRLSMKEAVFSARRFSDGSLPSILEPEPEKPGKPMKIPTNEDLMAYWERSQVVRDKMAEKWEERQQKKQQEGQPPAGGQPPGDKPPVTGQPPAGGQPPTAGQPAVAKPVHEATRDPAWGEAVRYQPGKGDGTYVRKMPRTLIRDLDIAGKGVSLPDQGGKPNPLDVGAFSIKGTMVSPILDPGEKSTLTATFKTAGAGTIDLKDYWRESGTGALKALWSGLPLEVLGDKSVAGEKVSHYRMSGKSDVDISAAWKDAKLSGDILVKITDPKLDPDNQAESAAQEAKKVLDQMREMQEKMTPGQPLVLEWKLKLAGKPWAPLVTGLNMGSFVDMLKERTTQMAKEFANKASGQVVDTGKKALTGFVDSVKDGKKPDAAGKDAVKDLKDSAGGLLKSNPFKK